MITSAQYKILSGLKAASENGKEVGSLRNPNTGCMCFQGVIVDEYLKEHGEKWIDGCRVDNGNGRTLSAWAPRHITDWSGLSEEQIARFTALNDHEGAALSLAQISTVLRYELAQG